MGRSDRGAPQAAEPIHLTLDNHIRADHPQVAGSCSRSFRGSPSTACLASPDPPSRVPVGNLRSGSVFDLVVYHLDWPRGLRNGTAGTRNCATGPKPTSKKRLASTGFPSSITRHLKSTNMLERMNQELKRRTLVVRVFPNRERCLLLIRALAVFTKTGWKRPGI